MSEKEKRRAILSMLKKLRSTQFDEVIFVLDVPANRRPPTSGTLAERSMLLCNWAFEEGQLEALFNELEQMLGPAPIAAAPHSESDRAFAIKVIDRVAEALAISEGATTKVAQALKFDPGTSNAAARAENIARMLVDIDLTSAINVLHSCHKAVRNRRAPEARAFRSATRARLLLFYTEAEMASLQRRPNGPAFVTLPATPAGAELAMARSDGREAKFRKAEKWPHGVNALQLPPETGPNSNEAWAAAFESHLIELTLDDRERSRLDPAKQRAMASGRLRARDPETEGCLYLMVDFPESEQERVAFQSTVDTLSKAWPSIGFINLDLERLDRESDLLWKIRDMLTEEGDPA